MALRMGLAGLGIHGTRYARHLLNNEVPGALLSAVCRADHEAGRAFAREHGVAFVEDPRALATHPAVDAVVAVLPPDLHPAVASACIEARRPILVEKPLAPSAREAEKLARKVDEVGAFLMVAHTLRFDDLVRAVRREAASLGPIRCVSLDQWFEPTSRSWMDTPGRGGALLNTGVHAFDLLRFLTGAEPVEAWVRTEQVVTRRTDDEFVAMLRLEPGSILATVSCGRTTAGRSGRITIIGERGQISGDHVHRTLWRIVGREVTDLGPIPSNPTVRDTLVTFVDCIRRGLSSPVTAHDAARSLLSGVRRFKRYTS